MNDTERRKLTRKARSRQGRRVAALAGRGWSERLAEAIRAIGSKDFGPALVAALSEVVFFDHCVAFAYRGAAVPVCLYHTFNTTQHRVFVAMYEVGPYLLDPFYHACRDRVTPGLHRMRDLAPDRFYQSEYFRSYYVKTGLDEEIGFFFPVSGEVMVALSLMRAGGSAVFSDRDMARLRLIEPVVRAICQKHWENVEIPVPVRNGGRQPLVLDKVLAAELSGKGLTRREYEIVGLLLKGHSSESTGRLLGISAGTAKIHRKNIYRKLGISSQAELFSFFVAAIGGAGEAFWR